MKRVSNAKFTLYKCLKERYELHRFLNLWEFEDIHKTFEDRITFKNSNFVTDPILSVKKTNE